MSDNFISLTIEIKDRPGAVTIVRPCDPTSIIRYSEMQELFKEVLKTFSDYWIEQKHRKETIKDTPDGK